MAVPANYYIASVNTSAGTGRTWIDASATLETAPLLYSCSLPIPPGI